MPAISVMARVTMFNTRNVIINVCFEPNEFLLELNGVLFVFASSRNTNRILNVSKNKAPWGLKRNLHSICFKNGSLIDAVYIAWLRIVYALLSFVCLRGCWCLLVYEVLEYRSDIIVSWRTMILGFQNGEAVRTRGVPR